ncbi:hypothetical protein WA158_003143 [Blastocystis sp. Blastoise]
MSLMENLSTLFQEQFIKYGNVYFLNDSKMMICFGPQWQNLLLIALITNVYFIYDIIISQPFWNQYFLFILWSLYNLLLFIASCTNPGYVFDDIEINNTIDSFYHFCVKCNRNFN